MGNVFKGWQAQVQKDGIEIGRCNSLSFEIATGVEAYYEIGSRQPYALTEGNEEVTGTLENVWIDNDLLDLTNPGGNTQLSTFDLYAKAAPNETGATSPYAYLLDCKVETGSVEIPQDGFITVSIDFRAKEISFSTEVVG